MTGFTRAGHAGDVATTSSASRSPRRAAFAALDDGVPAESVNALYPRLMRATRAAIAAFVSTRRFSDIGTPADYLRHVARRSPAIEGDRLATGRARRDRRRRRVVDTHGAMG